MIFKIPPDKAKEIVKNKFDARLSIYGALLCGAKECYTDNDGSIMLLNGGEVRIYSESQAFVCDSLEILKKGDIEFCCVDDGTRKLVSNVRKEEWFDEAGLYAYPLKTVEKPRPSGFTVGRIDRKFVKIINDYYTYKSYGSKKTLLRKIDTRESSAAYIGDKIAGWSLIHDDYAMGVMYVPDEYRRRGIAEAVSKDLMQKVINGGMVPFIQIAKGNAASESLSRKLGFVKTADVAWFGFKNK